MMLRTHQQLQRLALVFLCALFSLPAFAQVNRCLSVDTFDDGTEQHIEFTSPVPNGSAYTVELWAKYRPNDLIVTNCNNPGGMVQKNLLSIGPSRLELIECEGTVYVHDFDCNGNCANGFSVLDEEWHHFSLSQSTTGRVRLYMDGNLQVDYAGTYDNPQPRIFVCGPVVSSGEHNWNGEIDEIRMWDFVRSAEAIAADYACPLEGDEDGLVAYYPCDQGVDDQPSIDNFFLVSGLSDFAGADATLRGYPDDVDSPQYQDCNGLLFCQPIVTCPDEELTNTLNVSSAVDQAGAVLTGGVPDPFWALLNYPPLRSPANAVIAPPFAYGVTSYSPGTSPWWNTLSLGTPAAGITSALTTPEFGANNVSSFQPWRFRREFCLCEDADITIAGAMQADDVGRLLLYHDSNPTTPIAILGGTDATNPFTADAPFSFSTSAQAGNYHLEFEMVNVGSTAMGFSLASLVTTNTGADLLYDSRNGECNMGVLTVQKMNDDNCDAERSFGEAGLAGVVITILETTTAATFTGTTDQYGEVIFRALPYGTYSVSETLAAPWIASFGFTGDVTLNADNPVGYAVIGNKNPEDCGCIDADVFSVDLDGEGCCYQLRLDNNFGEYYDQVTLEGVGFTTSLLQATNTSGTVSEAGGVISLDGLLPEGQFQPAFEFCTEDLAGTGQVTVRWFRDGELVCEQDLSVECPDDCPGLEAENLNDEDDCCAEISFRNTFPVQIGGLAFRLDGSANFDQQTITPAAGLTVLARSAQEIVVGDGMGDITQAFIPDLVRFCLQEVTVAEQVIVIDYLGPDFTTIICSDTLRMFCPVSPECLIQNDLSPQLLCEEDGYRLRFVFTKTEGYVDSIGKITLLISEPAALAGDIEFILPSLIGPGQTISIDTFFPADPDETYDSLCVVIAAHDGPDERICCYVDSLCIPFPDCGDAAPCNDLEVYATPDEQDSCCYYVVVDTRALDPGTVDSLVLDTLDGFLAGGPLTGQSWPNLNWPVFDTNASGQSVAILPPGQTHVPSLDTIFYVCHEPATSPDSIYISLSTYFDEGEPCINTLAFYCPAVDPCDSLSAYILPAEEECCYDVYLNNTYADDPALQAVTINLVSGQSDEFSGRNLLPGAPGWNIVSEDEVNKRYTLTSSSGPLPQGLDQQVFQFCVEESFLSDSTYVEIGWVTELDTICTDTVAAICHDCMSVIEGELGCDEDLNPTFTFTFTNYSDIPGNTIRILNTVGGTVIPGLPDTIVLGQMVDPGDTYSGTITVTFPGAVPGQEICFDAVLEQVLPGEVAIRCCYITHCVTPENCDGFDGSSPVALSAFPNPTTGSLVLTSDHTGPAGVSLLSPTGRQANLQRVDFAGDPVPVALGDRPAGVYTILVRFDDGRQGVRRIVIE